MANDRYIYNPETDTIAPNQETVRMSDGSTVYGHPVLNKQGVLVDVIPEIEYKAIKDAEAAKKATAVSAPVNTAAKATTQAAQERNAAIAAPANAAAAATKEAMKPSAETIAAAQNMVGGGSYVPFGTAINNVNAYASTHANVQAPPGLPGPGSSSTDAGFVSLDNGELDKKKAADMNLQYARTMPSFLKPQITTDANGNEVITIQGGMLSKIMQDMYAAGQTSHLDKNQSPNPFDPVKTTANTNPDQQARIMGQLQQSYPQRSAADLQKIFQGNGAPNPGAPKPFTEIKNTPYAINPFLKQ